MLHDPHLDMSFSGLKTAVRYFIRDNEARLGDAGFVANVAASVQQAIVDVLVAKTVRAAEEIGASTVLLAGGVAANGHLRASLRAALAEQAAGVTFVEPPMAYTTDNAAMIGMAAYWRAQNDGRADDPARLDAHPDWELGRI
jgi:N6-L-threonylcarbamoyladenine synthase